MSPDQLPSFMTGPVTWEGLLVLGAIVTAINAVVVYYFAGRKGDLQEIRDLLTARDAAWDQRHEVHKAEVAQAHRELHDRISRTNDRILDTERTARNDTAKAIEKLDDRLNKRMDSLTAKIDDMTREILGRLRSPRS